jgi:hypothetical protein
MRRLLAGILCVSACGAACDGGRADEWDRTRAVLGPIAMKDKVAYVDTALDRVVVVDTRPDGALGTPRITAHRVGRRPLFAAPTPDRGRLAVVTRGQEAIHEGEQDEAPGLYLIDVESIGEGIGQPIRYELGSPFDRLAVAADGSVAVAYFSEGGPDSDGLFRNPNELAVLDLARAPSEDNPVLRTVRSFGSAPDGVVLSPPMTIPGAEDVTPRTFAFVLAPNTLTLLDATNPERREVTVRLTLDGTAVTPRELAFAPASGTTYLRADGARDVLEIVLSGETPDGPTDNDYRPALAELGAGAAPSDIAVYDDAAGRRRVLAATPGTRELAAIDADTAEFVTVPVPDPIDRILLLPAGAPRIAVLASIAIRAPRVHLVDLTNVGEELAQIDVRTVALGEPIFDVVTVPGHERALIVHDDARTVLGVLDVVAGTVSPIEGIERLDAYDFTAGGTHLIGAAQGVPRIGFVDLDNLHPSDVRLDDTPSGIFALASGGVYVDHGDPLGRATIIGGAGSTREQAFVLSGFLIDHLLDERF